MNRVFVFGLLFFAFLVSAQQRKKSTNLKSKVTKNITSKNGYTISIDSENSDIKALSLKVCTGNIKTTFALDSAKTTGQKQKILLRKSNRIISFPVLLSTQTAGNNIMLFLKNGIEINGKLDSNQLQNITVDDDLNKDFINYQKENDKHKKIFLAQQILAKYPDEGVQTFFHFEMVRLQANDKVNLEKAIKNTENAIKFSNKNIAIMPNSYIFLNEYFNNSDNYFNSLDAIFKDLNCTDANFKFYLNWILKNLQYRNSSAEDTQDKYQYILKNYLNTTECKKMFASDIEKIKFQLKENEVLPLDKPLPDFKVKDTAGKIFDFNSYLATHKNITILIFYDPNCEHCIENVPKEVKIIDELESTYKVKLNKIAILYVGALSQWQQFITNSHLENWVNLTSGSDKDSIPNIIPISGTPTFFILDKNGNVIVKNLNQKLLVNEILKMKKK